MKNDPLVISASTLMTLKPLPYMRAKETMTFGKWKVEPCGDMIYDGGRYAIYDNQLERENWILHLMTSKKWIDFNDFIPAYLQALRNAGIKKVTMIAYYD